MLIRRIFITFKNWMILDWIYLYIYIYNISNIFLFRIIKRNMQSISITDIFDEIISKDI